MDKIKGEEERKGSPRKVPTTMSSKVMEGEKEKGKRKKEKGKREKGKGKREKGKGKREKGKEKKKKGKSKTCFD